MSKIKRLPRNALDCLPDPISWNNLPPAVEQAYRRGYVQGWLEAMRLAKEGASPFALERFGYGRLWQWRYSKHMQYGLPPMFSGKKGKKK